MARDGASARQSLWAEIESLDRLGEGDAPARDAASLALTERISHTVSGFEKIRMLEALCAKSSHVGVFSATWTAHFMLGEAELRHAGMMRQEGQTAGRVEIPPHDAPALLATGRILVREGRFDEALRVFQHAATLRPDDVFAATWVATTFATLGRHEEADARFSVIGQRRAWPCAITRLSASFWRELDERVALIERRSERETGSSSATRDPNPVALVSCDRKYFHRYADAYVRAWATHGPREAGQAAWRLHIHLIDPDDECRQRIAAWRTEGLPVVTSEEALPRGLRAFIQPGSGFERRTFYACARLRALPRLLAYYRAPIVMTDIDLELCASPTPIWKALGEADAGLIRLSARIQPLWQEFYLALAVFRPSQAGRRFAAMVAAYVEYFLGRGKWIWTLDQAALYSASGEAARNLPGFQCATLPLGFVASDHEPSQTPLFRHRVASQARDT